MKSKILNEELERHLKDTQKLKKELEIKLNEEEKRLENDLRLIQKDSNQILKEIEKNALGKSISKMLKEYPFLNKETMTLSAQEKISFLSQREKKVSKNFYELRNYLHLKVTKTGFSLDEFLKKMDENILVE